MAIVRLELRVAHYFGDSADFQFIVETSLNWGLLLEGAVDEVQLHFF